MLKDREDALGHALYDYLMHKGGVEIIERDDGYFDVSGGPAAYFTEYEGWADREKHAMQYVNGRVLDIGCGAGRHALYLQNKGVEVVGIDISPLAMKVCKLRGVKDVRVMSITQVNEGLGKFDTILMMGNNFGLFGSYKRARWLLQKFRKITNEAAIIIAEIRDPYKTDVPEHLEYHELNRKRGRMAGQVRIRIRYKRYVTPWFDYLFVSKDELLQILEGTGWRLKHIIDPDNPVYIAVIQKEKVAG